MLLNSTGTPFHNSKPIEKCVICQDPLIQDIATISGCAHNFHKDCIENWKNITNSCPVCRKRFNYIQHGHKKYKVERKDQKNEDELTTEYLDALANEPCVICDSTDFADMALLCDGCDKCYHTHCLGIDAIPDGDWYCDTCKHLKEDGNGRISRRNNNNRYDINNTMISRNESNPVWIMTQDEDYIPSGNDAEDVDIDIEDDASSDNNEENNELKEDIIDANKRKRPRKRKRFEIDSEDDSENDLLSLRNKCNKRRKTTHYNKEIEDESWTCVVCTFANDRQSDKCGMCHAKRKSEMLSIDDYFSNTQDQNGIKKQKYSRRNPYKKAEINNLRTRGDIIDRTQRKECSIAGIVGNDIMSRFNLNEPDDWLSMAEDIEDRNRKGEIENDKNKNKQETIEDIDSDVSLELERKPKMRYRDRYRSLTRNLKYS